MLNVYASNNRASENTWVKTDRDKSRNQQIYNYGWRLHTSLSVTDRIYMLEINKDIELNNTINQLELIDIYRTLYWTKADYICFSSI